MRGIRWAGRGKCESGATKAHPGVSLTPPGPPKKGSWAHGGLPLTKHSTLPPVTCRRPRPQGTPSSAPSTLRLGRQVRLVTPTAAIFDPEKAAASCLTVAASRDMGKVAGGKGSGCRHPLPGQSQSPLLSPALPPSCPRLDEWRLCAPGAVSRARTKSSLRLSHPLPGHNPFAPPAVSVCLPFLPAHSSSPCRPSLPASRQAIKVPSRQTIQGSAMQIGLFGGAALTLR